MNKDNYYWIYRKLLLEKYICKRFYGHGGCGDKSGYGFGDEDIVSRFKNYIIN